MEKLTRRQALQRLTYLTLLGLIPQEAEANPRPKRVFATIDGGTGQPADFRYASVRIRGKAPATPQRAIETVTTRFDLAAPRLEEHFDGHLLVTRLLEYQNFDGPYPEKCWMLFTAPELAVTKRGRSLKLRPILPVEVKQREWLEQEAADSYNRTELQKLRPYVPQAILLDPNPSVRRQAQRLLRRWVEPHTYLGLVRYADFKRPGDP